MKTFNVFYIMTVFALVFGLLAAPIAFAAEDKDDNPLFNIRLPEGTDNAQYLVDRSVAPVWTSDEIETAAALSEEGAPVIIRDFEMDFQKPVGPDWNRIPGKND